MEPRLQELTKTEHMVFNLILAGLTDREIAYKLDRSEETIKSHRKKIIQKFYAKNIANAIHKYYRSGSAGAECS